MHKLQQCFDSYLYNHRSVVVKVPIKTLSKACLGFWSNVCLASSHDQSQQALCQHIRSCVLTSSEVAKAASTPMWGIPGSWLLSSGLPSTGLDFQFHQSHFNCICRPLAGSPQLRGLELFAYRLSLTADQHNRRADINTEFHPLRKVPSRAICPQWPHACFAGLVCVPEVCPGCATAPH